MSDVGSEKRQFERTAKKLEICFGSYDEFVEAYTENVGMGGLFVMTEKPSKIGEKVYLQFNLPGTENVVQCEGEVRWLKKQGERYLGMGIGFSSLSHEDKNLIDNYVHRIIQ
ncbi:MAG: TIGR02266 family protein [Deltaproteobacteria bacterium]|nr:TIGR02266 family protein [Deltaproteobacteria bacterium]